MMNSRLSPPFVRIPTKTSQIMAWVLLCLLPGLLVQSYQFGIGSLIQVLLAGATAVLAEALILKLRKRPILPTISDNSALLTGVLIGLSIPSYAPWWIAVIGSIFAIVIVKQLYGGLGNNLFNPAAAAYVLLLVSFPVVMTSWLPVKAILGTHLSIADGASLIFTGFTVEGFSLKQLISLNTNVVGSAASLADGYSGATPLDLVKTQLTVGLTSAEIVSGPNFSWLAGLGWEWINLAYLLGGLVLLKLKVIRWHLPAAFLGSLLLCSLIGAIWAPDQTTGPMIHLFSGATMIGAFFIITDPVSAATSHKGRIIYACLIGFLVYVIRTWGGYPDALAFAVLLANMCVPLLDHFTKTRVYGYAQGDQDE